MITAAEVLNVKFQATKFRDGYDQDAVDDFLDTIVATLRALESGAIVGPHGQRLLGPDDVREHRFPRTKYREGYDISQVDAMLATTEATLQEYADRVRAAAPVEVPVFAHGLPAPSGPPLSTVAPSGTPTGSAHPDGMGAFDVVMKLQTARGAQIGDNRDRLLAVGPDGVAHGIARIENTPDGVVLRLT